MKRTNGEPKVTTSKRARQAGLKRISRRHVTKPGEVKLSDCKVRVTMYLDADVLEYFKQRATRPHAAPYQTQINSELRNVMEQKDNGSRYSSLVEDEGFISAVAARVRERRAS